MTKKEWIYIGGAGAVGLGLILWYAHSQASANAAANAASQQTALQNIAAAMNGGGYMPSSYYGMSGSGGYIPQTDVATSTGGSGGSGGTSATSTGPGTAVGSSSDPVMSFLQAYLASSASAQQSALDQQITALHDQLSAAQQQNTSLQGQYAQAQSQLTAAQQQAQSYQSQYVTAQGRLSSILSTANAEISSDPGFQYHPTLDVQRLINIVNTGSSGPK